MSRMLTSLTAAALLLSCSDAGRRPSERQAPPAPDTTFAYTCEGGLEFVAAIRGDTAWVFLPSRTAALPRIAAGTDAGYGDGGILLRTRGDEGIVELVNEPPRACRNDRARAVWEHAKLSGVDFRAVGNEPGWHLEIAPDSIRLVTDYGAQRRAVPTPDARMTGVRTVYRAASGGDTLEVLLEPERCRDSMSGEAFETTVTVRIGARELRGCGQPLH